MKQMMFSSPQTVYPGQELPLAPPPVPSGADIPAVGSDYKTIPAEGIIGYAIIGYDKPKDSVVPLPGKSKVPDLNEFIKQLKPASPPHLPLPSFLFTPKAEAKAEIPPDEKKWRKLPGTPEYRVKESEGIIGYCPPEYVANLEADLGRRLALLAKCPR